MNSENEKRRVPKGALIFGGICIAASIVVAILLLGGFI